YLDIRQQTAHSVVERRGIESAAVELPVAPTTVKLLNLFRRRVHEREMDAEMRFHVDMEAAELQRDGLSPDEARRQALVRFGGVRRYKEEGREARGGSWLEDLVRDLRYSTRSLWHAPGYATVVILTLALGIAAN